MNSPFVTNLLLMVIAVLLLVIVIQNGMNESSSSSYRTYSSNPHPAVPEQRSPAVSGPAPHMNESMFFQALSGFPEGCDKVKTLAECSSPAAEAVKQEVLNISQSRGVREVFDYVINKYGMTALTEQAQQIRRARTGQ